MRGRAALLALLLLAPAPALAGDYGRILDSPLNLWLGLKEEAAPEGLVTLAAAGAAAGAATTVDTGIKVGLQENPPLGSDATHLGAWMGDGLALFPAAGLVYLAGARFDSDRTQEFGQMSLEALALSGAEALALKYSVRRERPDGSGRDSFPSGHAASAFSVAAVAGSEWGWEAGVPAYVAAAFVGYSRLELNKHYLSDVLFGAGLGIASGRAVWRVHRKAHPERFAVVPLLSPGRAGVAVLF